MLLPKKNNQKFKFFTIFQVRDLPNPPAAATSDGTPIEFLGEAMCTMELGPWYSDGQIPLLVAWDCPADVLIGQDLIKVNFWKNLLQFSNFLGDQQKIPGQI